MDRIVVCLTEAHSYDDIRVKRPLRQPGLRQALWDAGIALETRLSNSVTLASLEGIDNIVFHGVATAPLMNILRRLPCRFSLFVDDLMFKDTIPAWNPHQITHSQEETFRWMLRQSAAVVFTTEALRDATISREPIPLEKCHVQPNLESFNEVIGYPHGLPLRAIYAGGSSHAGDLELIANLNWRGETVVWSNCLPTARTAVVRGKTGALHLRPDKKNWGWVAPSPDYETYRVWRRNLGVQCGVGLAPLVDCPFNACKSNLKFLEYTAMGLVSVVSNVMPYSELPDDICVKVVGDEWTEAVEYAVLHTGIAQRAYEWCRENHGYDTHWKEWLNTYRFVSQMT